MLHNSVQNRFDTQLASEFDRVFLATGKFLHGADRTNCELAHPATSATPGEQNARPTIS